MKVPKKILVPTDFSRNAFKAAEFALKNFTDEDVEFTFVHVYRLHYSGAVLTQDLDNLLSSEREKMMDEQLASLTLLYPDAKMSGESVQGFFIDAVSNVVAKRQIDLIVAGTKGASGMEQVVFGSNAANLMRAVDIPVVLVPENWEAKAVEKIVLASDLKLVHGFETIEPLYGMVKNLDAHLDILHLTEPGLDSNEMDREELKLNTVFMGTKHQFHFRKMDSAEDDILDFAHDQNSDLVAMIARNHGFLYKMLQRSLTRKLSMHTDVPLLILKEQS